MSDAILRAPTAEVDTTTGMPRVPEGYFWRVQVKAPGEYESWPTVTVQLRKRAPLWLLPNRSVKKASLSVLAQNSEERVWIGRYSYPQSSDPELVPTHVRSLAFEVFEDQRVMLGQAERRTRLDAALDAVVGDYPPKELKVP